MLEAALMTKPHITRRHGRWAVTYPYIDQTFYFNFLCYAFAAARAWDMREEQLVRVLSGEPFYAMKTDASPSS